MIPAGQTVPTRLLNPAARTALVRWMLDPVVQVSPEVREALVRDVDITTPSIFSSFVALVSLNGICCILAPGRFFVTLLAINVAINSVRLGASIGLVKGWCQSTPAFTDFYVISTLVWALVQSVFIFGAVCSNVSALQTLCLLMSTAFQGLLCARNYPAPRFAMTIFLLFETSMVAGSLMAADHWLWMNLLLMLPWIYGSLSTIQRFQKVSISSLSAQFASEERAQTDPLTNALNRLGLGRAMAAHHVPAEFALFCLDLDGFKKVNDSFGHLAGDTLLKLVTERLRHAVREGDIVARLGGDEFIVVAPNIGPKAADSLAERIVETISRDPYRLSDTMVASVGVSVGIACQPRNGTCFETLQALADEALYSAKEQGKGTWRQSAVCAEEENTALVD